MLAISSTDVRTLVAMVDDQHWLVVWKRNTKVEWKMDAKGRLQLLTGAEWDLGMDWLWGLTETEFREVVRLEVWERREN